MNEDVLEATINTVIASEGANSSTSFVVDCDDPSKNKMMILTDKIDEFMKHEFCRSSTREIDQGFRLLSQFLPIRVVRKRSKLSKEQKASEIKERREES